MDQNREGYACRRRRKSRRTGRSCGRRSGRRCRCKGSRCWSTLWSVLRSGTEGRGGRRLDRYYQHLAEVWRRRWSRALYWHACLDLARCREQSRPFHPWQAHLEGRVLFQDQDSLSIRLDAEEVHGDGRPLRVRMGDVWSLPEGVPLPAGACFPGDRRWWLHLTRKLREQGEVRRAAGDCFLDPDFGPRLRQFLSPHRYCRTPEGLEFYVPQCALAPAAEGVVAFSLPLERK
ncbi:MAG: hypothetical protein ACLUJG_11655 [Lawsonibacter sp.]